MNFLSPAFFWTFLSLVPLCLIYLLKVRPRRKPTTAYFLWENIFHERRPNRLLQRLRDLWSLLLMLLAFSAICLALTRPEFTDEQRKDILLLIDNSASMSTIEGRETRLDAAKQTAIDILRALNGTQRAAVASVAHDVQYLSHLSNNPRELIDAVRAIQPTEFEFRPQHLTSDTTGSHEWLDDQRVLLLSDLCFDTSCLPARIELFKTGSPIENVGLVKADLGRLPGANNRLGLYIQVHSTHGSPVNVDLLVYQGRAEGDLFRLIPLLVQPGLNEPQIFELEDAADGAWRIRLDIEDALINDNVAQLAIPPAQPIRVQVSSSNRFFFENSVLAFSGQAGLLQLVESDADIAIHQGGWDSNQHAIVFHPQGQSSLWGTVGEAVEVAAPKLLIEDHPVIRHIDVSTMSFDGAVQLQPPENAQVIVASEDNVPLIFRVMQDGRSVIVVNLDPIASEFYFSAWFPVLVHGAASHLAGREDEILATYRPGDSLPIPRAGEGETTITFPDGSQVRTKAKTHPDTSQTGFYAFQNNSAEWLTAISLTSVQESNVNNADAADTSRPIRRGWPLSHLLTILAVVVLGLESILYHRRKVG